VQQSFNVRIGGEIKKLENLIAHSPVPRSQPFLGQPINPVPAGFPRKDGEGRRPLPGAENAMLIEEIKHGILIARGHASGLLHFEEKRKRDSLFLVHT